MAFWIKNVYLLLKTYQKTCRNLLIYKFFFINKSIARQLIGRFCLKTREESPGSIRTRCQITSGEGNFRDSATENKPPYQGKGEKVW